MEIKTEIKSTIETTCWIGDNKLKTKPCDIGEWYGNDICNEFSFDSKLSDIHLPDGKYNITILLEKISD